MSDDRLDALERRVGVLEKRADGLDKQFDGLTKAVMDIADWQRRADRVFDEIKFAQLKSIQQTAEIIVMLGPVKEAMDRLSAVKYAGSTP